MTQVVLSSKYQVVIPKEIRKEFHLEKGQKFSVVAKEGLISLIPSQPLKHFRGFIKKVSLRGLREKRERL